MSSMNVTWGGVRLNKDDIKSKDIILNKQTGAQKYFVEFKNGTRIAYDESDGSLSSVFLKEPHSDRGFNKTYADGIKGLELQGTAEQDDIHVKNSTITDIDVTGEGKPDSVIIEHSMGKAAPSAMNELGLGFIRADANDSVELKNTVDVQKFTP